MRAGLREQFTNGMNLVKVVSVDYDHPVLSLLVIGGPLPAVQTDLLTHPDYLKSRRFSNLDGLRAVSILLVFTAHPASEVFWPRLHGATGVTYFFVLSGFLITTLLLREESRAGAVSLRAFYVRRVFRIYPMFFAALALYCVMIFVLGMQQERRDAFIENIPYYIFFFPEHAVYFNNNNFSVPFNGAWSIGIEEKFYLVWPVLAFVLLRRWRNARLPLLCVMGSVLLGLSFFRDVAGPLIPYQHIVYGAIIAEVLHDERSYRILSCLGRTLVLLITCSAVAFFQFGTDMILPGRPLYGMFGILVAALVAGLVTTARQRIPGLASRPMVYLGAISYVMYLTHNFFINAVELVVPERFGFYGSLLSTITAFALSVAAASLIHKYFEEPLRLYGVGLAKRWRRDASSPVNSFVPR